MSNIHDIDTLLHFRNKANDVSGEIVQGINFQGKDIHWDGFHVRGTVFLGCVFPSIEVELKLREKGAIIFPHFEGDVPYNPYRSVLYSWQELMQTTATGISYDEEIYNHFSSHKNDCLPIMEALAQRIHDHAIDDALQEFLAAGDDCEQRKAVGIMGGHSVLRTDPYYKKVVQVAYYLAKKGYLVVSGGGPGMMEATNLGAYLSLESEEALDWAIDTLATSPHYTDKGYIEASLKVIDRFSTGKDNLAIPTWFYGHEPSNLFATAIAKYFSNSIREDNLLSIALHGIVFAPGSAGTTQEIFQDAAQNHYGTLDYLSPMVFLGKKRYEEDTQLFKTLQQLAKGRQYESFLYLTDEVSEVVRFIVGNPPKEYKGS